VTVDVKELDVNEVDVKEFDKVSVDVEDRAVLGERIVDNESIELNPVVVSTEEVVDVSDRVVVVLVEESMCVYCVMEDELSCLLS
jgi:hypothetical protein